MSDDPEAAQLLELGIEAAKRGRKLLAYEYFSQVVSREPNSEEGWLWLGGMSENPAESVQCMERALAINPASKRASEGLNWAKAQIKKAEAELAAAAAPPPAAPPASTTRPKPDKPARPAPDEKPPAQQSDFEYIFSNFMQAGTGRKVAIVAVLLVLLFTCCVGFFIAVNNLLGIV